LSLSYLILAALCRHPGPHSFPTRRSSDLLADELAVAQDRHPVGDLVDLVEEVRHEQDRDALVLQPPHHLEQPGDLIGVEAGGGLDRKSTRLNSSHVKISYAVFCLKKKTKN